MSFIFSKASLCIDELAAGTTTFKGCLVEGEAECADVEKVLCFCGNDRESGEMACCEL